MRCFTNVPHTSLSAAFTYILNVNDKLPHPWGRRASLCIFAARPRHATNATRTTLTRDVLTELTHLLLTLIRPPRLSNFLQRARTGVRSRNNSAYETPKVLLLVMYCFSLSMLHQCSHRTLAQCSSMPFLFWSLFCRLLPDPCTIML